MSTSDRLTIGIVVEHTRIETPWPTDRWQVVEVLPGRPATAPGTVLAIGPGWRRWYAGATDLELFSGETDGYRDNLHGSRPAVYVILRRADDSVILHGATVDSGEIEAHADVGDDIIEAVPLPEFVADWMQHFIARHHVERPFYKRQRDRADPDALARRRHTARTGGEA